MTTDKQVAVGISDQDISTLESSVRGMPISHLAVTILAIIQRLRADEADNDRLRAENAALAAWQCIHSDGKTGLMHDECGNASCAKDAAIDALRAEVERLRTTIENVAAIAHYGGWVGLGEDQALVYVRALTVGSMPGGSLNDATAVLQGAIDAARAAQEGET